MQKEGEGRTMSLVGQGSEGSPHERSPNAGAGLDGLVGIPLASPGPYLAMARPRSDRDPLMPSIDASAVTREPFVKCQACGADIPLSTGWGPVGDKRFVCSGCGEVTDLVIRL